MTTVIVEKRKYTYADYVNIPDDKRYELIGGATNDSIANNKTSNDF